MSDARRRSRQRARDQGQAGAEVTALAEELRAGRVTLAQVELAALVGWPAAREVLGRRAPPLPRPDGRGALAWFRRLRAHDPRTLARALVAIARARHLAAPKRARAGRRCLQDLDGWLLGRLVGAQVAAAPPGDRPATLAMRAARDVTRGGSPEPGPLSVDDLAAVRDELGPWALGGLDPVARRWRPRPEPRRHPPGRTTLEVDDDREHRAFLRAQGRMKDWSVFD